MNWIQNGGKNRDENNETHMYDAKIFKKVNKDAYILKCSGCICGQRDNKRNSRVPMECLEVIIITDILYRKK